MDLDKQIERNLINARLENIYGLHTDAKLARFRVTWAPDEIIQRHGEFWQSAGGVELSVPQVEVRTVPKYLNLGNQWIVERLIPNYYKDVEGSYIYECLHAFPEGLPLNERAVNLLLGHIFRRVKGQTKGKLSAKDLELQRLDRLDKEKQRVRDMIDLSDMNIHLRTGSGVSLAGLDIPVVEPAEVLSFTRKEDQK